jgi:hypothetical protein
MHTNMNGDCLRHVIGHLQSLRDTELQFHPMDEEHKPIKVDVPGWPYKVKF